MKTNHHPYGLSRKESASLDEPKMKDVRARQSFLLNKEAHQGQPGLRGDDT